MWNNMKYELGKLLRNTKVLMILGFDLVMTLSLFYGFWQYLGRSQEEIQYTEVWSFSMAAPIFQTMMLISFLMLLSDFPGMEGGFELYLMRTTKRKWLFSQYGVLLCATLLFIGWWLLLLMPWGHGLAADCWSGVFQRLVNLPQKESVGIFWDFRIIPGWIYVSTPYTIFFQNFLLQFLKYLLVGLVMLAGNIMNRKSVSIVVIFLFWLLDYSISEMEKVEKMYFLSPFTLTKLNCLNLGFDYNCPGYEYALGALGGMCIGLGMFLTWKVRRVDFQKHSLEYD